MVKLSLKHGKLNLEAKDEPSILVGFHRSFFELAVGYSRDVEQGSYFISDPATLHDVLVDTVEYLQGEGFSFEMNAEAQKLMDDIVTDQIAYKIALTNGLKVKTESVHPQLDIPGFYRQLRPYQAHSVNHLVNVFHGANFSVPGSGKTTIIYATFAILRAQNIVDKLFVVGPRSSFMPWEEEYYECYKRVPNDARLTGSKHNRQIIYASADEYEVFLCTYQTVAKDVTELINLCKKFQVFLVLDESHNIKKFEGGVWADAVMSASRYATRRAILSGTPVPNTHEDLWTQMTFLWPSKQMLGGREEYAHRAEREEQWSSIKSDVKPFFMRIRKADLGLPQQHFKRIDVPMNPYQANIYKALSVRILSELTLMPEERSKLREWRKAKMVRLIQAASNPTLLAKRSDEFNVPPLSGDNVSILQLLDDYPKYEKSAKMEKATTLVKTLIADGNKVLVWTSFVLNIKMLQNELEDLEPLILYGAVPADEKENEEINREQQIRKFKESRLPLVLLANPAACAESISLHRVCHHAIYLDRTFDCGRYMQSVDRIHRIGLGSNEDVFYYILKSISTIDETIDRRLIEKEDAMKALLEDNEIPTGSFELPDEEKFSMSKESEEQVDFDAAITDLKKHYEVKYV